MDLDHGDTRLIIKECLKRNATLPQASYILATARWETNHTMKPVEEAYWLSDEWRAKNLRYYPWHGRGYVQITWMSNYAKVGIKLDRDLTTNPKTVMVPAIAAEILVMGSLEGWFTKHKLTDHINANRKDYMNARRVINGTDKAEAIATLAARYEAALIASGYGMTPTAQSGIVALIIAWLGGLMK